MENTARQTFIDSIRRSGSFMLPEMIFMAFLLFAKQEHSEVPVVQEKKQQHIADKELTAPAPGEVTDSKTVVVITGKQNTATPSYVWRNPGGKE